jgi:HTH-type transcriptional regulator, competence development regulator
VSPLSPRSLEADEEELLILAKRVPEPVRERFFQRPDVFCAIAKCDDATLDKFMKELGQKAKVVKRK